MQTVCPRDGAAVHPCYSPGPGFSQASWVCSRGGDGVYRCKRVCVFGCLGVCSLRPKWSHNHLKLHHYRPTLTWHSLDSASNVGAWHFVPRDHRSTSHASNLTQYAPVTGHLRSVFESLMKLAAVLPARNPIFTSQQMSQPDGCCILHIPGLTNPGF